MEISVNNESIDKNSTILKDELTTVEECLNIMEIPFNWNLYQQYGYDEIDRFEEKLEEIADPVIFEFRSIILQCLLAYEYFNKSKSTNDEMEINKYRTTSLQKLKDCESVLHNLMLNNCKDPVFECTYKPFMKIILGCKMFVMSKYEMLLDLKEVFKLYKSLEVDEQDSKFKAATCGIKASMLMEYGNEKLNLALENAILARRLDPSIPEWHFVFGNILARIRRLKSFSNIPQNEEMEALERTVELSENPRFRIHLAQTLREKGFIIFKSYRYDEKNQPDKVKIVDDLYRKSFLIYKQIIHEYPDNARYLARCAFGITKLSNQFRDVNLCQISIEKAYDLAPNNPMVNHYKGIIYERYVNKEDEAIKYYETASNLFVFGATINLVSLKFKKNSKDYNPVPYLTEALKRFPDKERYFQILSQIASYHFFIEHNIPATWKNMEIIIAKDKMHSALRAHKSAFLRMNDYCDLIEVVLDEIKLKMAHQSFNSEEEKDELMSIGCRLRELCPNTHHLRYLKLKNKILDKSRQLITKSDTQNKREYNRKFKNKKPNQRKPFNNVNQSIPSYRKNSKSRSISRSHNKGGSDHVIKNYQSPSKNTLSNRDRSLSSNRNKGQSCSQRKDNSKNANSHNQSTKDQSKSSYKNYMKNIRSLSLNREKSPSFEKWSAGSREVKKESEWLGPNINPGLSYSCSLTNLNRSKRSSKSPVHKSQTNNGNYSKSYSTYNQYQNNSEYNFFPRSQSIDRNKVGTTFNVNKTNYDNARGNGHFNKSNDQRSTELKSFHNNYSKCNPKYTNQDQNEPRSHSLDSHHKFNVTTNGNKRYNANFRGKGNLHNLSSQKNYPEEILSEKTKTDIGRFSSIFMPKFGSQTSLKDIESNK